jgi:hypothetical protein
LSLFYGYPQKIPIGYAPQTLELFSQKPRKNAPSAFFSDYLSTFFKKLKIILKIIRFSPINKVEKPPTGRQKLPSGRLGNAENGLRSVEGET